MQRAPINPDLLRWARERAGLEIADISQRFPKLGEWEAGERLPTLRQVEAFARAVHVPVGYLFLREPPEEPLPIPDFRTLASRGVGRPSPNLLDTLYACEERQAWFREHAQMTGQAGHDYVGSVGVATPPEAAAKTIRKALGIEVEGRRACQNWSEALRLFIRQADAAGILVMVSGVVLNNNRRPLDPEEFRGFALADPLAPLVFINGADTKAAQMFTLAHELAHLWLGASGLSDVSAAGSPDGQREEVWCNRVAAEILAPRAQVRAELHSDEALEATLQRLTRTFKVSSLVVLRRLLDVGHLDRATFEQAWDKELDRVRDLARQGSGGGDFYRTTMARVSPRFARALVVSTLEGQTLYRDAFRMLGVKKTSTFNELGRQAGVMW